MLVQFYNPTELPGERLDQLLAEGWFRSSMMLHKSKVICLDYDTFSIINIRYDLRQFTAKKRHRKLMRRVFQDFEVSIGPMVINEEKNELYDRHKQRFKGFIHEDLDQLMHAYLVHTVFETYEVNVYHQGELVAFSFFDLGEHSLASILAVYNQDFNKYSLGIFTMLAEITFGQENHFQWYYPGYVLDKPSEFDYKLSLGSPLYRTASGDWTERNQVDFTSFEGTRIKSKVDSISLKLNQFHIDHIQRDNPYYSLAYIAEFKNDVLKGTTITLLTSQRKTHQTWCIEYLAEADVYLLSKAGRNTKLDYMLDVDTTEDLNDESHYLQGIWVYFDKILTSNNVEDLIEEYLRRTASTNNMK